MEVKNTGKRDGDEIVQVYIRRCADVKGPKKSLKAFQRISLQAGETKNVTLELPRSSFEVWDETTNTMSVVSGKYEILVGNSSRDCDLKKININLNI